MRFPLCLLALLLLALPAAAQDSVDLTPPRKAGQRYAIQWKAETRLTQQEYTSPMGTMRMPINGYFSDSGEAKITVADVQNGKFRILEIHFGRCTEKAMKPGGTRPADQRDPLSTAKVKIERRVDPDFKNVELIVSSPGRTLAPSTESDLKALFGKTFLPQKPVQVGQQWTSEDLHFLGSESDSSYTFQLRGIQNNADGRRVAILSGEGQESREFGSTIQGGGTDAQGKAIPGVVMSDMHAEVSYRGQVEVDLETGTVLGMEWTGTERLEHGASMGPPIIQTGTCSYTLHGKILASEQPKDVPQPLPGDNGAKPKPAPAAQPPAAPENPAPVAPVAGGQPFTQAEGRFHIVAPKGWKLQQFPNNVGVAVMNQSVESIVRVFCQPAQGATTGQEFYENQVKGKLAGGKAQVEGEGARKVGGQDGYAVAYTIPAMQEQGVNYPASKGQIQFTVVDGHAIICDMTIPQARFHDVLPQVKEILESFQVYNPPQKPAAPKKKKKKGGLHDWD